MLSWDQFSAIDFVLDLEKLDKLEKLEKLNAEKNLLNVKKRSSPFPLSRLKKHNLVRRAIGNIKTGATYFGGRTGKYKLRVEL